MSELWLLLAVLLAWIVGMGVGKSQSPNFKCKTCRKGFDEPKAMAEEFSWDKAPDWANYLCVDFNGDYHWFFKRPSNLRWGTPPNDFRTFRSIEPRPDSAKNSQLSGKQGQLNPIPPGSESGANVEDSEAGEFNGLTLEVNPKPKSFRPDPFWDDAPGWANYWVMDPGGGAWWFERKPKLMEHVRNGEQCQLWWTFEEGRHKADRMYADDTGWKTSLTSRPSIQEQQS